MQTIAELRTQIRNWSEREDILDAQLDHFITLTEKEYKNDLYLPSNEKIVELVTDANGNIAVPADYLKMKSVKVVDPEGYDRPVYRKPNDLVVALGSVSSTEGIRYFERSGDNFIFAPAPGAGVTVTMTYYSVIPTLVDAAEINFVMDDMPTIYLFGALMFLFMYTFNEERAVYYKSMYDMAKADLIGMQDNAEMSGSSLQVVATMSDDGTLWQNGG